MGRFFTKILYGAEYYIIRFKGVFIAHGCVVLAGAILGIAAGADTALISDTDSTVIILITGGFGSVFWRCLLPNLIIAVAAFCLGLNRKTVWLCLALTFFRGMSIGGFCVSVFCIGFSAVLFILFFCLVQAVFCALFVSYIHAFFLDNACSWRNCDFKPLCLFLAAAVVFSFIQCILLFLCVRTVVVF